MTDRRAGRGRDRAWPCAGLRPRRAPPRRPPTRRALAVEGLVVYLVLQALTVLFLPALRSGRETFYDDVLLGFFGPEKHGLARLLRQGVLPVWLDSQYGGEPFLANLQHGVLYPGNLPFWLLPHLDRAGGGRRRAPGPGRGLHVGLLPHRPAHRPLGGGPGRARRSASGSVTLQHIILLNQLQVIAWMPLVLLFGHLALERGRLRWVVLCGVAAGLQLLAGHPEEWVYTLFALATYGLAWTLAAGLARLAAAGSGRRRSGSAGTMVCSGAAVRLAAAAHPAAAAPGLADRARLRRAARAPGQAGLQRAAARLRQRAVR